MFRHYVVIVFQKIGFCVFYIMHKFFVRIEIRGKEHLVGLRGPIILAPNHTSELDVTALPMVLPFFSSHNPVYFVMNRKEKYNNFGWKSYLYRGKILDLFGGQSVYSGYKNYATALRDHIKLLRKKRTICIFPEGRRTLDGQFGEARGGLGYLVYTAKATAVPVAINTFFKMTLVDFFGRKRKVVINIGKPIKSTELLEPGSRPKVEDFRRISQIILDKSKEMIN